LEEAGTGLKKGGGGKIRKCSKSEKTPEAKKKQVNSKKKRNQIGYMEPLSKKLVKSSDRSHRRVREKGEQWACIASGLKGFRKDQEGDRGIRGGIRRKGHEGKNVRNRIS